MTRKKRIMHTGRRPQWSTLESESWPYGRPYHLQASWRPSGSRDLETNTSIHPYGLKTWLLTHSPARLFSCYLPLEVNFSTIRPNIHSSPICCKEWFSFSLKPKFKSAFDAIRSYLPPSMLQFLRSSFSSNVPDALNRGAKLFRALLSIAVDSDGRSPMWVCTKEGTFDSSGAFKCNNEAPVYPLKWGCLRACRKLELRRHLSQSPELLARKTRELKSMVCTKAIWK